MDNSFFSVLLFQVTIFSLFMLEQGGFWFLFCCLSRIPRNPKILSWSPLIRNYCNETYLPFLYEKKDIKKSAIMKERYLRKCILMFLVALAYRGVTDFVCGAVAGCCAMTTAMPLDVIRTRLVAQGEPKVRYLLLQLFSLCLICYFFTPIAP